ncbi:CNIPF protein, partial [Pachycephala philippinensis]|nr:CNIPF protein [Pachycephala philippinensis]
GLDAAVQGYPFEAWGLSGPDLLGLDAGVLEALGMWPLGHQELLLEAVEQLRNLDTGLASTSLRTLTERLQELAQGIQSLAQEGLSAGDAPQPPSLTLLARVIDLVGAAKELFSWLNRYLFSTLNDFSASRDIILLCAQLAETLQEARGAARAPLTPLCHPQCQHIVGICESIVGCSPPALLDRRAVLQRVGLELPPGPRDSPPMSPSTPTLPLGLPASAQALAAHGGHILPGDEIVQVNEQVVVGWTPVNLARKLLEKGNRVTLVLKKIPLDLPGSPPSPRQQVSDPSAPTSGSAGSSRAGEAGGTGPELCRRGPSSPTPGQGEPWVPQAEVEQGPSQRWGRFGSQGTRFPPSVAADLDSGPDSAPDPVTDEEEEEDERDLRLPGAAVEELPGLSGRGRIGAEGVGTERFPPGYGAAAPLAVHRCCRGGAPARDADQKVSRTQPGWAGRGWGLSRGALLPLPSPDTRIAVAAGVATRLSRRRVSCRDLGRVDCDGWLLKKKDHVGFMAQKWKRCWFVLKGHTLYWYNHPNDERAAGLINVATYNLESTREQKKKYVFQLCHQTYKPFVFAAETLADLSMWVSRLVTAKTKYTLAHQAVPDKEEDCYSETEAEDPDDESPRHGSDSVSGPGGHPGDRGTEVPCLSHLLLHLSLSQGKGCRTPQTRRSSPRPAAQPAAPRAAPGPAPPWVGPFQSQPLHDPTPSPCTGEPCGVSGLPSCSSAPCPCPDPAGEDLEDLMQCLRQGGVSLMGQRRFLTQEQCRKSFLRRNKNPHINERVHAVRALQSTLKAKLAELQALEQLLGEAALTSDTFRRWKEQHQELYQELREGWAGRQGQGHEQGDAGDQHGPHEEAAEP